MSWRVYASEPCETLDGWTGAGLEDLSLVSGKEGVYALQLYDQIGNVEKTKGFSPSLSLPDEWFWVFWFRAVVPTGLIGRHTYFMLNFENGSKFGLWWNEQDIGGMKNVLGYRANSSNYDISPEKIIINTDWYKIWLKFIISTQQLCLYLNGMLVDDWISPVELDVPSAIQLSGGWMQKSWYDSFILGTIKKGSHSLLLPLILLDDRRRCLEEAICDVQRRYL